MTLFFWRVFIAVDQLLNVLSLGSPKHTISARVGFYSSLDEHKGAWGAFERAIDWAFDDIQPDHCKAAYDDEAFISMFIRGQYVGLLVLLAVLVLFLPVIKLFIKLLVRLDLADDALATLYNKEISEIIYERKQNDTQP